MRNCWADPGSEGVGSNLGLTLFYRSCRIEKNNSFKIISLQRRLCLSLKRAFANLKSSSQKAKCTSKNIRLYFRLKEFQIGKFWSKQVSNYLNEQNKEVTKPSQVIVIYTFTTFLQDPAPKTMVQNDAQEFHSFHASSSPPGFTFYFCFSSLSLSLSLFLFLFLFLFLSLPHTHPLSFSFSFSLPFTLCLSLHS